MEADILNISPAMLNLIWLGLFILLLVIEIITVGLTTIWFAAGALAALAANVLGANLIIQIIIFLAVSVVLLIFTRPWAVEHLNKNVEKTNVDSLIGENAVILEEVDNLKGTGKAMVNGLEWSARTEEDGEKIEKDTVVTIEKVQGVKLIVRRRKEEAV